VVLNGLSKPLAGLFCFFEVKLIKGGGAVAKIVQPEFTAEYKLHRIPGDVVAQHSRHPLLTGLQVTRAGYFPRARGQYVERDSIGEYILIYCLDGAGWYRTADQFGPVAAGDAFFVLPGTPHAYGADDARPWIIQWAHFKGDQVSHLLALAGVSAERQLLQIGRHTELVNLFDRLFDVLARGYSLHYLINAAATLRQILSSIALLASYSPPPDAKVLNTERIINYMMNHLTEPSRLDDFATQAFMSRSHFSRRFHEKTGYAPYDYFIRLKIQKACELLETTDLNVGEISQRLGYTDPYYFSRLFKKVMHQAPTRYRQARNG
jgi:AraC-like DNA-binding protein